MAHVCVGVEVYVGLCGCGGWLTLAGTMHPQLARRAATVTARMRVDLPDMLGAVSRKMPRRSKLLPTPRDWSIQYGIRPSTWSLGGTGEARGANVWRLASDHPHSVFTCP